jgi:misacylated tRNA(Ala) deacylase
MNTDLVYLRESYLRELTATVVNVIDHKWIVLDQTIFYPQGGGQPGDTGSLSARGEPYHVFSTTKNDGVVLHEVDKPGLQVGDTVHCIIDWSRRYAHMRHHTAAHVLSAVVHNQAGALITGNQIYEDRLRIDFSLADYDPVRVQHYIDEANRLLALHAPVVARTLPREQALLLPGVVKLAGAHVPANPELRILTIGDERSGVIDEQADGGTHVANTREVGTMVFVGSENKGKSNRRVVVKLEQ